MNSVVEILTFAMFLWYKLLIMDAALLAARDARTVSVIMPVDDDGDVNGCQLYVGARCPAAAGCRLYVGARCPAAARFSCFYTRPLWCKIHVWKFHTFSQFPLFFHSSDSCIGAFMCGQLCR